MQRNAGGTIDPEEFEDLQSLNRLMDILKAKENPDENLNLDLGRKITVSVTAVSTRISEGRPSQPKRTMSRTAQDVLDVQGVRLQRLQIAQDEELETWKMKQYLKRNLTDLTQDDCKKFQKVADSFEIGNDDLLNYVGVQMRPDPDGKKPQIRVVLPSTLHQEILHHYHTSLIGGHQGITAEHMRDWSRDSTGRTCLNRFKNS